MGDGAREEAREGGTLGTTAAARLVCGAGDAEGECRVRVGGVPMASSGEGVAVFVVVVASFVVVAIVGVVVVVAGSVVFVVTLVEAVVEGGGGMGSFVGAPKGDVATDTEPVPKSGACSELKGGLVALSLGVVMMRFNSNHDSSNE
jgi:hypothetical protein